MIMAAGALLVQDKKILIVKPSYLDYWLPPGGGVEDGESPRKACIREVYEEIGLQIVPEQLLCVDFIPKGTSIGTKHQQRETLQDEVVFMFFGGYLSPEKIAAIRLDKEEVTEFRCVHLQEAMPILPNYLQTRFPRCLDALSLKTTLYLENGHLVSSLTPY